MSSGPETIKQLNCNISSTHPTAIIILNSRL
jgi:hypothetical protein